MTSLDVQTRRFVSFYYKLVVNFRNSMIVFTPNSAVSTKLDTCTLICIIDLLFKVHLNEINDSETNYSRVASQILSNVLAP